MAKAANKSARAPATKQWTVMVYLAGDNNLDSAGTVDISEMKKVGSTDQVSVIVQFDRSGARRKTNRYYVRKGTTMAKDVVQSLGETNMGDPAVLEDFIRWGIAAYPAEKYLLVLWNHGAGWDDSNIYAGDAFGGNAPPVARKGTALGGGRVRGALPMHQVRAAVRRARRSLFATTVAKAATTRAIAFDDQAQDYLDNIEMKNVLAKVKTTLKRKLDILGFDACLMSMAEVAYQVKGQVAYCVGSQQTEPNEGWPYDRVLKALAAKPAMSGAELARACVQQYVASYGQNDGVTQAATDLGKIPAVGSAVNELGKVLAAVATDAALRSAVMTARAQVQEYEPPYDEYVDLIDLCALIAHNAAGDALAKACDAVRKAVAAAVLENGAKGARVANSNGLSIYFPKKSITPLYAKLDFVKNNAWSGFLKAYLESTTRRP